MNRNPLVPLALLLLVVPFLPLLGGGQDLSSVTQEEAQDYYQKWLNQDVVYVITDEERAVFQSLGNAEEKEQFIEQFWFRRDPDPRTAANEFKEEHYRRIAYANERFNSGIPGWKTDRGRIYIIHGPPAEIESHAAGGYYQRPMSEGGGSTTVFPFEVWRYRHIEGIGSDVLIEFVDPSLTGEFRIALRPEEKDAMLYVPGGGPTLAEELGLATKAERPFFQPGNRDSYPLMAPTERDNPFRRYEIYAQVQRPVEIKYEDLRELVKVNVGYASLPLSVHEDYFRLNSSQTLVPITVQIPNRNLSFKREGDRQVARVGLYGIITSMSNRVISEFEDDLIVSYSPEEMEEGRLKSSIYQKIIPVDSKMRYKVDLIVKDLSSEQVGVVRRALSPPVYPEDLLCASSLILSNYIVALDQAFEPDEMFVLGDVKIRPNLEKEFSPDMPLGLYLQVYNSAIDQASLQPSLEVTFQLLKDGSLVEESIDREGESMQFFSGQRAVLIKGFSLNGRSPGTYQVKISVRDQLTDQKVQLNDSFQLVPSVRLALGSR